MIRPVGLLSICVLGLGCTEQDETRVAVATDSVAVVSDIEIGPDSVSQVAVSAADPFDDFGLSTNDVAATVREIPLWLINQSTQALIVTARGGAASVVVDTVSAADSTFVNINTRAPTLELSARTSEGVAMGTVDLSPDARPGRVAFPH